MENSRQRVLVLGASGMLGHTVTRVLAERADFDVVGAVRTPSPRLTAALGDVELVHGLDATSPDSLARVLAAARADVVINCVGLIKQLGEAETVASAVPINTLLPHRLQQLTELSGARLVHVSTDCVFDGKTGGYSEASRPTAYDVYGLSKYLGEVTAGNAITIRTSIIGPELQSANGLVEWFLSQNNSVRGFTRAIFSGLPTVTLARLIADVVLPRPDLHGLYQVSSEPTSKFDLLTIVREIYGKSIEIVPDDELVIDRSLDSSRFRETTGWSPAGWPDLVREMKEFG